MGENHTDIIAMESFTSHHETQLADHDTDDKSPSLTLDHHHFYKETDSKVDTLNKTESQVNNNHIVYIHGNGDASHIRESDQAELKEVRHDATLGVKKKKKKPLFGNEGEDSRYKVWMRVEQISLAVVICIIWGLFALPIIFYHIPMGSSTVSTTNESSNENATSSQMCLSSIPYDGTVCMQELKSLSSCLSIQTTNDRDILVESDQSSTVGDLLNILIRFGSDDCKAIGLPFLCVYFFGLCDSTGRAYRPSSSQCVEVSTGVCAFEWETAKGFEFPGVSLPDCESFPDETTLILTTETCDIPTDTSTTTDSSGSASGSGQELETTEDNSLLLATQAAVSVSNNCSCNEGFFCDLQPNKSDLELNFCFPECGVWEEYSHSTVVIIDVIVIMAAVIGIVSGVGVLIITAIRRKKVLVFPSVLAVYQTITIKVLAFFVLVNYMDRTGLYCGSRNLVEAIETATPFCIISGMVFHYTILQLALWWLFHMAALFWKIQFPFHARKFESAHYIRYIHFTAVILALILPAIPIIIAMIGYAVEDSKDGDSSPAGRLGFGLIRFPPILCVANDPTIVYYSFALPLNLIVIVGIGLLVLIFWIIHKQHGLFRVKQSKNLFKIETAERKILIVFCYYVVLVIFSLLAFTITTRDVNQFSDEIEKYFKCELLGPSDPCTREGFEALAQPEITSIAYILLGLFPFVNLVFVINVREVKEKFGQCGLFRGVYRIGKKAATSASVASTSDSHTFGTVVPSVAKQE